MVKYLDCIRNHSGDLTEGISYEVSYETPYTYVIRNNDGTLHHLTKQPDCTGRSYKTWFKPIEEAENLANLTVLKDESIGGIEREYTEVKRKAAVGERIKIVDAGFAGRTPVYFDGDVLTVTRIDRDGDREVDRKFSDGSQCFVHNREYVTLEPTDIVRIGNVRYRLTDRKAYEGERIVAIRNSVNVYDVGHVGIALSDGFVNFNGQGNPFVHGEGVLHCSYGVGYRVLEPLATPKPSADIAAEDASLLVLSRRINEQKTQIDGLTDAVGRLTLKVTELERGKVDGATGGLVKVVSCRVGDRLPPFVKAEPSRDEIVAKAKRDVAELERQMQAYPYELSATKKHGTLRLKFVINRDKRTVVALTTWGTLRDQYGDKHLPKGIAKCAPGECFNVHIGRAIALRRALGLEVPAEYTNAPVPSEPRVGDVVDEEYGFYRKARKVAEMRPEGYAAADEGLTFIGGGWTFINRVKIIDDSREELAEAPQPKREPAVGDRVNIIDPSATNIGHSEGLADTEDAYIGEIDASYKYPYLITTRDTEARIWSAREAFEVIE